MFSVLSMKLVGITMFNIAICKSLFVSGFKYICGHLSMSWFVLFCFFLSLWLLPDIWTFKKSRCLLMNWHPVVLSLLVNIVAIIFFFFVSYYMCQICTIRLFIREKMPSLWQWWLISFQTPSCYNSLLLDTVFKENFTSIVFGPNPGSMALAIQQGWNKNL